jgi:hypothetical protein
LIFLTNIPVFIISHKDEIKVSSLHNSKRLPYDVFGIFKFYQGDLHAAPFFAFGNGINIGTGGSW